MNNLLKVILLISTLNAIPTPISGFNEKDDELAIRPFQDFACKSAPISGDLTKPESSEAIPAIHYLDKQVPNSFSDDNWFIIVTGGKQQHKSFYSKVAIQIQLNDASKTLVGQFTDKFRCILLVTTPKSTKPLAKEAISLIKEFNEVQIDDGSTSPPRVAVIEFKEPVSSFAITFKIPQAIVQTITKSAASSNAKSQTGFYAIMTVITDTGECLYNQVSSLYKLQGRPPETRKTPAVPYPRCKGSDFQSLEVVRTDSVLSPDKITPTTKAEAEAYQKKVEVFKKKDVSTLKNDYANTASKPVTMPSELVTFVKEQETQSKLDKENEKKIISIGSKTHKCDSSKPTTLGDLTDPSKSTAKMSVFYTPYTKDGWVNVKVELPAQLGKTIQEAFVQAHTSATGAVTGRFSTDYPCKPTAVQSSKSIMQDIIQKATFIQYSPTGSLDGSRPTVAMVQIKSPYSRDFVISLKLNSGTKEIFIAARIITKDGQCFENQISPVFSINSPPPGLDTKGTDKDMPFSCEQIGNVVATVPSKAPNPIKDEATAIYLRSLTSYKDVGGASMGSKLKLNVDRFNQARLTPTTIATQAPTTITQATTKETMKPTSITTIRKRNVGIVPTTQKVMPPTTLVHHVPTQHPTPKVTTTAVPQEPFPSFCATPGYMVAGGLCSSPGTNPPDITEILDFSFSKLPFPEDRWLHIDIFNKPNVPEEIHISQIAISIVNFRGSVVGEFSENIPCTQDHKIFKNKHNFSELKDIIDPDLTSVPLGLEVYNCKRPMMSGMAPPSTANQAFLSFKPAVSEFYFHYKFTTAEFNSMEKGKPNSGFQMILLILDSQGRCYTPFLTKRLGLVARKKKFKKHISVAPLDCHAAGGVEALTGKVDEFVLPKNDLDYRKKVVFRTMHPSQRAIDSPPNIDGDSGRIIEKYNHNKYNLVITTRMPLSVIRPRTFKTNPTPKIDPARLGGARAPKEGGKQKKVRISPKQELYLECFHTRGCFGQPDDCVKRKSCQSIVSYVKSDLEDDFVRFEMLSESFKYIAVGLSRDASMGDDSVVECVREQNNEIRAYTSWNYNKEKEGRGRTNIRLKRHDAIKDVYGTFEDGVIYCTWLWKKRTTVHGHDFDLENEKFYILSASGSTAIDGPSGNVEYHDRHMIAKDGVVLYAHVGKSPNRLIIGEIHGVLMIFVWMFLVPVATFLTRYFKETFLKYSIRNYSLWFGMHLICMSFTIGLTIASVILIYAFGARYPGSDGWDFHTICGLLIILVMILQIPLAYGIIKYNKHYKYLTINCVHGIDGHILFFLGFTCMFKSRYMRDGLPCDASSALIAWIVVYMLIHLCMSYQVCYSDFVQGRHVSRVYSFGPLDIPERAVNGKEEPGAVGRKVLLVIFLFFALVFLLSITVQYVTGEMMDCAKEQAILKRNA